MCHKGQVRECKILFPYVAFMSHITVFIIFIIDIIYGIMVMVSLIDLKSINNIVSLMGGTIRYLSYLRVPDLDYK
jgi:hypothetical protein